jgi:multidrug efflux pump subunit AcrB
MTHSKPRNAIEWAMLHWRIIATLSLLLVFFGAYSLWKMPRQEFPQFTIRQGLVVAVMPGGTSRETEEQVTRKVEDYLFSFDEVDKSKTYSYSRDGQMVVYVELKESINGLEAPAFWARLRHGLNELKAQSLSSQVVALIAVDDFGDTSALLLALTADGKSWQDIDLYMRQLEAELRKIPATSKLKRSGEQEESIRIVLSRDRLAQYGIRPLSVFQALQGTGMLPMAGSLEAANLEMPIHVSPVLHSEKELGETVILSVGNSVVHLKDIARLERGHLDNDAYVRYNGKRTMILSLEMSRGNDITGYGKDVDQAIARVKARLPAGVEIARIADQPLAVTNAIDHFMRDFFLAIVAVVGVTMLFLPLRVAAVAAVTIPICVFITVGILNLMGIELQTVSLAGLVVVLGMVVDNAIIVIDNHLEKLDHGMPVWNSAWKSAKELMVPVFTATLAIILCYLPMAIFMKGTSGDFIKSLPATVAVALFVSMLVAAFLVPAMDNAFIRKGITHGKQEGKKSFLDRLQHVYDRFLEISFRHPALTVGAGILSVILALVIVAGLPQQLFPKLERNQFAVEITLQKGRPLTLTDSVASRLDAILRKDPRVVNVTSFVGSSSPRFHTVYAPTLPSRSYVQLLVNTTTSQAADEVVEEYSRKLRGSFPDAWVRWKQLEMQGFSTPIEIRLWGDSLPLLQQAAAIVQDSMRGLPVDWVRTDWEDPLRGIRLNMDWEEAGRLGISPSTLGASLAMGSTGFPVGTIWEGDHPVSLRLREDSSRSKSLEGFRNQLISSFPLGASVPLSQVATSVPDWTPGTIAHRNGMRCLTVRIDQKRGVFAMDVQNRIDEILAHTKLPEGVTVSYGGEVEDSADTFLPMVIALGTSIVLVFLVLLCQFHRFRKTLLVMMTMPLSLFGAAAGLWLCGYPFCLTAFVGIIGLMGIVVRNGIILVGYADELRAEGLSLLDASIAAGKRRMRPIFLTSMAAAMGVVPMIVSRSPLWGPLGAVTAFGLVLSMILTLFVLPVAYWIVSRSERPLSLPEGAHHA